jgi:hypothetical protein
VGFVFLRIASPELPTFFRTGKAAVWEFVALMVILPVLLMFGVIVGSYVLLRTCLALPK